ncbi:MAG: ParA family protein [Rhodospirillales bacterium]|jgi:chromosome partitioning protein|nr:ParA family protein [Rhodospirillales bacterium]
MSEPELASRIISVCNLKGGAGKSTIAVNLACALRAVTGLDCILVDADRQATALAWAENGELGIRVTSRVLHEARREDPFPGLAWVKQIRLLAQRNPAVIIDLPPGLDYALAAVTAISDLIFVPVNPSGIDLHSTARFVKAVQKARVVRGGDKPLCVIVPNRTDRRAVLRNLKLYERFGEPIAPPIGLRPAFVQAFDRGRWVGALQPKSEARLEIERLVSFVLPAAGGSDDSDGVEDRGWRRENQGAEVIPYRAAGLGDRPIAQLIGRAQGGGASPPVDGAGDGDNPAADGEGTRR